MEHLLVEYTFHPQGADGHPFAILPRELAEAAVSWASAHGRTPPDTRELQVALTNTYPRFAPRWLRLCSAVSRHEDFTDDIRGPSNMETGELMTRIFDRARKRYPEANKHFVGEITLKNGTECLERILQGTRRGLYAFTDPIFLFTNMQQFEKNNKENQCFIDEVDDQDLANRAMELHGIESCPEALCEALCDAVDADIPFRELLPMWLNDVIEYAQSVLWEGNEESVMLTKTNEERLWSLVNWSANLSHSVVKGNEHRAYQVLMDVVQRIPGILDRSS